MQPERPRGTEGDRRPRGCRVRAPGAATWAVDGLLADGSPRTTFTPNHVHPEPRSPHPRTSFAPTPEPRSPITIKEPSVEPSWNRKEPAGCLSRPPDVTGPTWRDFLALRKAKRA